jgi:hypothetical protein
MVGRMLKYLRMPRGPHRRSGRSSGMTNAPAMFSLRANSAGALRKSPHEQD